MSRFHDSGRAHAMDTTLTRFIRRLTAGAPLFAAAAAIALALAAQAWAMVPPTKEQLDQYKKDGTLATRVAFAKQIGNDKIAPHLARQAQVRLQRARLQAQGKTAKEVAALAPMPPNPGAPSTGTLRIFALPIAFPEYPPLNNSSYISDRLGGAGSPADYPYESVHNFYQRSSYGQLDIQCDTLPWYVTPYPRSSVAETMAGRNAVIKEAINYWHSLGWNFSQYDNNADGRIDYFIVLWTGPADGWGAFWWSYETGFYDLSFAVDGKALNQYSWVWESGISTEPFAARAAIHETGHALGLPDLYDSYPLIGPPGGDGGFDMMDSANFDHNCWSKWMLGWITPTIVSTGSSTITMRSSGSYGDAALVMQNTPADDPFTEYFLAQYRAGDGNDSAGGGATWPAGGNGVAIWHVDGRTLTSGIMKCDNSVSSHKLLRLMEADGLEQIEKYGPWNPADLYVPGNTFGPSTTPNSARYDGADSRVTVDDFQHVGSAMSARFAVNPPAALAILNDQLPDAEVDHEYYARVTVAGGTAPYTWTLVSGSLPPGLSLVPSTGEITGTPPPYQSSWSFTLCVTDSQSTPASATAGFSLNEVWDLTMSMTSLPDGQTGIAYSTSLRANGSEGYKCYTLASGDLPPGLALDMTGLIAGTPTTAGTWSFTARVTTYNLFNNTVYDTLTKPFSITIAPGALTILTSALPSGSTGVDYSEPVMTVGGTPPYRWVVSGAHLPSGLVLSPYTGYINGTPTATGTSNFIVMVTDSAAVPAAVTKALSIVIVRDLAITTASFPAGHGFVPYNQTATATGGIGPYIWMGDPLPDGLLLDPNSGTISGTPTAAGTWNFVLWVYDRQSPPDSAGKGFTFTIGDDLAVATSSMPNGHVGVAYNQALAAWGGQQPYTWDVSSEFLPAGLSCDAATGVISGTPTVAGTSNCTAIVRDAASPAGEALKALSITILSDLVIDTEGLPDGSIATAYSTTLEASGGQAPYTWSRLSGSLPPGLTLDASTGVLSGTPATSGAFGFNIQVADSQSPPCTARRSLLIAVTASTVSTYYVATTGSDSNPGTFARPWLTLQHAVDTSLPGDTILVEAGTYSGCFITNSGGFTHVKTLKADTGAAVTIQGTRPGSSTDVLDIGSNWSSTNVWNWVIDGFTIDGSARTNLCCVLQGTANVTFRNCTFSQSNGHGIYASGCQSLLLEGNSFSSNPGSGVYLCGGCNVIVRNNVFSSGGMYGLRAQSSVSANSAVAGMLVTGNRFVNNPSGMLLDGVTDSTITNNLVYGSWQEAAIWLDATCGASCCSNNLIYNNTAYAGGCCVKVSSVSGKGDPTGNKVKNNILYSTSMASVEVYATDIPGFESDYNVVVDRFSVNGGGSIVPLAVWQGYGYDEHSVICRHPEALFVDLAANDCHLKAGSLAVDAGTTLAEVTADMDGFIRPQGSAYDIGCYELPVVVPVSITTSSLPDGKMGVAYSQSLAATGGVGSGVVWSLQSGNLPDGLTIDTSGTISGTPTAYGTWDFTVKATDAMLPTNSDTKALSIKVAPLDLVITTTSLAGGQVLVPYSQPVIATGGATPYAWSIVAGSLPSGLSIDAASGVISGTLTVAGTADFSVQVSDTFGTTATCNLSIVIAGPTVQVLTPNGGEAWAANTVQYITWTSSGTTSNVRIALWDGETQRTIASNYPNTGTYRWRVPATVPAGTGYRIQVSLVKDPTVYDYTDGTFTIPPFITVKSPAGGATWQRGTTQTISWTSNTGGTVNISLYKGSSLDSVIATGITNIGSFSWPIPASQTMGTGYKVEVRLAPESTVYGASGAFSITGTGSYVTVTSPNGGEYWQAGSAYDITWTSDCEDNVKIQLYKAGSLNRTINSSAPNTGRYSWAVPAGQTLGGDFTVKVTCASNSALTDTSDAAFTIARRNVTVDTLSMDPTTARPGQPVSVTGTTGTYRAGTPWEMSRIVIGIRDGGGHWVGGEPVIVSINEGGGDLVSQAWTGPDMAIAAPVKNATYHFWAFNSAAADDSAAINEFKSLVATSSSAGCFKWPASLVVSGQAITVTSPNGGEVWASGSFHSTTWTSYIGGDVRIDLYKGATLLATIAPSTPNNGVFSAQIPSLTGTVTNLKVKITSLSISAYDYSDASFTISPTLSLQSPGPEQTQVSDPTRKTRMPAYGLSARDRIFLRRLPATVLAWSSAFDGPAYSILDNNAATSWKTAGTLLPEREFVVIDLRRVSRLGAVTLSPGADLSLFPTEFTIEVSSDNVTWKPVVYAKDFSTGAEASVWRFEPTWARYVRISGPGIPGADGRFYWLIGGAHVYRTRAPM